MGASKTVWWRGLVNGHSLDSFDSTDLHSRQKVNVGKYPIIHTAQLCWVVGLSIGQNNVEVLLFLYCLLYPSVGDSGKRTLHDTFTLLSFHYKLIFHPHFESHDNYKDNGVIDILILQTQDRSKLCSIDVDPIYREGGGQ